MHRALRLAYRHASLLSASLCVSCAGLLRSLSAAALLAIKAQSSTMRGRPWPGLRRQRGAGLRGGR